MNKLLFAILALFFCGSVFCMEKSIENIDAKLMNKKFNRETEIRKLQNMFNLCQYRSEAFRCGFDKKILADKAVLESKKVGDFLLLLCTYDTYDADAGIFFIGINLAKKCVIKEINSIDNYSFSKNENILFLFLGDSKKLVVIDCENCELIKEIRGVKSFDFIRNKDLAIVLGDNSLIKIFKINKDNNKNKYNYTLLKVFNRVSNYKVTLDEKSLIINQNKSFLASFFLRNCFPVDSIVENKVISLRNKLFCEEIMDRKFEPKFDCLKRKVFLFVKNKETLIIFNRKLLSLEIIKKNCDLINVFSVVKDFVFFYGKKYLLLIGCDNAKIIDISDCNTVKKFMGVKKYCVIGKYLTIICSSLDKKGEYSCQIFDVDENMVIESYENVSHFEKHVCSGKLIIILFLADKPSVIKILDCCDYWKIEKPLHKLRICNLGKVDESCNFILYKLFNENKIFFDILQQGLTKKHYCDVRINTCDREDFLPRNAAIEKFEHQEESLTVDDTNSISSVCSDDEYDFSWNYEVSNGAY